MLVEVTNILRRLEKTGRLTSPESTSAQRDLLRLDVELVPFHPFADRVWALRNNLTSYDAWYVAVAEALRLPLATLDARLARAIGPSCRFLLP
jgi:predicted nucleic acid-binding protein